MSQKDEARNGHRIRILIVEDVWMIAMGLRMELERIGYEVVGPVGRLGDGLKLIEFESIDGALLDINLDGEPVFPLAEALERRGIPYLFLTGYDEASLMPAPFRDRPVIRKPYQSRRLTPVVLTLFGRPGSGAEG